MSEIRFVGASPLNSDLASTLGDLLTLLAKSSDGECAIYLKEDSRRLLLYDSSSITNNPFIESIFLDDAPDFSNGNDVLELTATEARSYIDPSKSTAESYHAVRLSKESELVGFILAKAMSGKDRLVSQAEILHQAAHVIEGNLRVQSDLNSAMIYNDFLMGLVDTAGSFDITMQSKDITERVARLLSGRLDFDHITISFQLPEDSDSLKIGSFFGIEKHGHLTTPYRASGSVHGQVSISGAPLIVDDYGDCSLKGRFEADDFAASEMKSFLGVPILADDNPVGVVAIECKKANTYKPSDIKILEAVAQFAGTALKWSNQYRKVHDQASYDGLTQLLNHRAFLQRFGEELERGTRYGESMTLLMMDLDDFKLINDTHGHLYGDYMLWQVAQLIRSGVRKPDIPGRYGGEEFVVIIINSTKESSQSTAERIRKSIADFQFESDGSKSRITISIGMAEYPKDGQSIRELIKHADQAMYRIKDRGGNSVVFYSKDLEIT